MRRFPPRTLFLMVVALGAFLFMYWRTAPQRAVVRGIQSDARGHQEATARQAGDTPQVACVAAVRWLEAAAGGAGGRTAMEVGLREGLIALQACKGPPPPGLCEAGRRALAVWTGDAGSPRAADLREALCERCGGCGDGADAGAAGGPSPAPDAGGQRP